MTNEGEFIINASEGCGPHTFHCPLKKTFSELVTYVTRFLYQKVCKKMRLKWPNFLRKIPKLNFFKYFFVDQKSILRHYYIHNVKDEVNFRAYKINKENVTHFS